jgi:hypothetical protein
MRKTGIYADTSVIGGCCDSEFQKWSNGLLEDFGSERYSLLLSSLTDAEIEDAPDEVKDVYRTFRELALEILDLSDEAIELADEYIRHGIIPNNYLDDARHIAIATIAVADILVSWNFRHIVHFEKIQKFNAVNLEMGYKPISIHSPREVTTHVY